jgi:hypothetical protein
MRLNKIKTPSIDPFISHMRIMYEENIRSSTEKYWREKIADELKVEGAKGWGEDLYGGTFTDGISHAIMTITKQV